jgi:hypothetical protein
MAKDDTLRLMTFLYKDKPYYFLKRKYGIAKNYLDRLNETTLYKSEVIVETYHRPTNQFNKGKKQEFKDRTFYNENKALDNEKAEH